MQINTILEKLPTSDSFDVLAYVTYYGIQGKKILENEQKDPTVDHETFYLYEKYYKSTLKDIFGKETLNTQWLYHGTGKYSYTSENKYYGEFSGVQNKLDNILKYGINPHPDNWLPNKDHVETTSLAPAFMYAKWYASTHNSTETTLSYEFGKPFNWFMHYIYDTVSSGPRYMKERRNSKSPFFDYAKESIGLLKRLKGTRTKREDEMHNLQRWHRSINSTGNSETELMDILTGHSDIPNNYGAILGIDKQKVKPVEDISYFGLHEIRTDQSIKPDNICFIITPYKFCEDAKNIAKSNNIDTLILPQECVEYHLTKFPLAELTDNLRTF